jgi:folylpolyglutamate synthase
MPVFFSMTLLMALSLFLRERVDVVILEVGLGGEYDATNFIRHPVACGVTSLHVEHADELGHTVAEIAWHKAGIAKVRGHKGRKVQGTQGYTSRAMLLAAFF